MESIKNFEDFYANKITERFNRLPNPSEGKVKKISFRVFGKYIESYAGYDEDGTYLRFDDQNWKSLNESIFRVINGENKEIKITNILSINDKTKKIQFELNDDKLLTCSFSISFFTSKKKLKELKGGYIIYIKNV